jgi:hypothetical protein
VGPTADLDALKESNISHPQKNTATTQKIQPFRREENPNFNLISLNYEEAITITIAIFEYQEVYIVP